GHRRSEDEILEELLRDHIFYEHSGGGVTLSGGEASFQMEAAGRILKRLKEKGIHTLVETCGAFDMENFSKQMLPHLDLIYYDLKPMNPRTHKKYCGADNQKILSNFKTLARDAHTSKFELVARTPLVPGITDTEQNLGDLAHFLKSCGIQTLSLLPYHPMGMDKWRQLGRKPPALASNMIQNLEQWLPKSRLTKAQTTLETMGIKILTP
ncbi:MAG: radical SAM protein, partial [Desulfovibrionales bacterium]|nr:radical SAM protein [Desulfovibrionales bacterium]